MDIRQAGEILSGFEKGSKSIFHPGEIATQAATAFLHSCDGGQSGETTFLDLIFAMARSDDEDISRQTSSILYSEIIEKLCDDFTPHSAETANRVLLYLLARIRETEAGTELDRTLQTIGYTNQGDLESHYRHSLTAADPGPDSNNKIRKILIPSRVTVGADVAITSILIFKLRKFFRNAELIIVGPSHLPEIFHNLTNVSHLPFEIKRHGDLYERILFWPELYNLVSQELAKTSADKIFVVDPESRLTQLGLLPLSAKAQTFIFPSRTQTCPDAQTSLSALTNHWLTGLVADEEVVYPRIELSQKARDKATRWCDSLRRNGCHHILLANFGVGGDDRKKLSSEFELRLLLRLLKRKNTIIMLDIGCSSEEKVRAEELIRLAAQHGIATSRETKLATADPGNDMAHGLVSVCSSIGLLAALAEQADCYIGYDSCGQHFAAAVDTPTVTIFAGHPNPRFIKRWTPLTRYNITKTIPVETGQNPNGPDFENIIKSSCRAVNNFIDKEYS